MSSESDSESAISPKTDDIDYWTRVAPPAAARKEYGPRWFTRPGENRTGPDVTLHFDISIWRRAGTLPFDPATSRSTPLHRKHVRGGFLQPCPRKNYCIIRGIETASFRFRVHVYTVCRKSIGFACFGTTYVSFKS